MELTQVGLSPFPSGGIQHRVTGDGSRGGSLSSDTDASPDIACTVTAVKEIPKTRMHNRPRRPKTLTNFLSPSVFIDLSSF